jgi:hypothetical protein
VVKGHAGGTWRTTPVNVLNHDGHRYLVSVRGHGHRVRNLRAAGTGEELKSELTAGVTRQGDTDLGPTRGCWL